MTLRSIFIRTALVTLGLLPFIIIELSLRFFAPQLLEKSVGGLQPSRESFGIYIADRYLSWKLKPNFRKFLTIPAVHPVPNENNPEYKYSIVTNSEGYRTWEVSPNKNPGTYRIICLGDSTTFGWGVNSSNNYPSQLNKKILYKFKDKNIEVLNFGVPGYSSRQGLVLIRDFVIPRYSPDLIIVGYSINDAFLAEIEDKYVINDKNLISSADNFMNNLAIYNALSDIIMKFKGSVEKRESKDLIQRVSFEDTKKNLDEIASLAKKYKLKIIFLNLFPSENMKFKEFGSSVYDVSVRHKELNNFFSDRGYDFIDGTTLLKYKLVEVKKNPEIFKSHLDFYIEYFGNYLFNRDDLYYLYTDKLHPNSLGYEFISEAIFDKIIELGFIK